MKLNTNLPIPGLSVIYDFVSPEEEAALVEAVNKEEWSGLGVGPNPELKRRTQQYGHLFSYRYREVLEEYGPLPPFVSWLVTRIMELGLMPVAPNHLLVNEYNAGQGIMPHIDAPALFGPSILSLSLLSPCVMSFQGKQETHNILLPRRSMVVLQQSARYDFKHGISKELIDYTTEGDPVLRDKRISLTFREIIAWSTKACHSNKNSSTCR
ncbi:hypothetical protein CLU79DRAFT_725379 [Phycomyces nitens]|nr:hypothetical protein CLU79DRAFT_725379 [Phycomyces nitens]